MNDILKKIFDSYGHKDAWLNFIIWIPFATLLGCIDKEFITVFLVDIALIAIAIGSQIEYWKSTGEISSGNIKKVSFSEYKKTYGYDKITWMNERELQTEIEKDERIRNTIRYLIQNNSGKYENYFPQIAAEMQSPKYYLEKDLNGYYKLYICPFDHSRNVKMYFESGENYEK